MTSPCSIKICINFAMNRNRLRHQNSERAMTEHLSVIAARASCTQLSFCERLPQSVRLHGCFAQRPRIDDDTATVREKARLKTIKRMCVLDLPSMCRIIHTTDCLGLIAWSEHRLCQEVKAQGTQSQIPAPKSLIARPVDGRINAASCELARKPC